MAVIRINDIDIHLTVSGEKTPFIWGHGMMGSMAVEDCVNWFRWDEMSDVCRLIRYDARGHGKSGFSPDPEDYHWSSLATDMIAVARSLGIGRAVVGGQSMGCATAIYTALAAPDLVEGLVLVNPPTAWGTRKNQSDMYRKLARLVTSPNNRLFPAMLKKNPQSLFPDWLVSADRPAMMDYIDRIWQSDPGALEKVLLGAALCDLPAPADLASIQVPTIILAWDGDSSHPLETALILNEMIGPSELITIKGAEEFGRWPDQMRAFVSGFSPG